MKEKLLLGVLMIIVALFTGSCSPKPGPDLNHEKQALIDSKVEKMLRRMTLEEKIGQMTQVTIDVILKTDSNHAVIEPQTIDTAKLRKAVAEYKVGSILNVCSHAYTRAHWYYIMSSVQKMALSTRMQIPVLYGIDAVHGINYTEKATLFPQPMAMAATWDPSLAEEAASITAYETRASYIPWNFSPVLDIGRNPLWPRLWETYGEDVLLAGRMGEAMIRGYQGDDISDKYKVAACLKHYMGYSLPYNGKDRTPAWIPEIFLREYVQPPFAMAVKAGALTVMVCSGETNGIPVHADRHILTDILHEEMKLKGFAVSDWEDIKRLHTYHHIAETPKEAVKIAVNAGIDMSMVPFDFSFADYLLELVKEGAVSEKRIDEAVGRILKVKFALGLFENPYYPPEDYPKFGSEEFRQVSLQSAREAITLLKNDNNVLPLPKSAKVLVTGFTANSMSCLNGGWTYTWQGDRTDGFAAEKSTILEAIQNKIGIQNVKYVQGCTFDSAFQADQAAQMARTCDYIILCLGENSYTEQMGNIDDLYLPDAQAALAQKLASTGKPVILVLAEGRPRVISKFADKMKGILMAYLPGNEGGEAVADILFGDVNPSGKLPVTYPKYPNALYTYDHKYIEDTNNTAYRPQFPFGFGLSYTTFTYSNLKLDKTEMSLQDSLNISIDVTNTGKRTGKEVVQLYIGDLYASITPSVKRLRGFEKVELEPGQTKTITFVIRPEELAFVNHNLQWTLEPGDFEVSVDVMKAKFRMR